MKKISIILLTILVLSACSNTSQQSKADLHIVTTISPLYSLTANLIEGVDNVELSNIVPANASIHTFTIKPLNAKQISQADIIVKNGLEMEEFLNSSLSNTKAEIVDTSKGVSLLTFPEVAIEGDEHQEEEEQHGVYDPHIWLSPKNAQIQASNIRDALVKVDPKNSDKYNSNYTALHTRLDKLIEDSLADLASLNIKPYIVFHDAYQYFERDFGVKAVGFLEESVGKEPSAQYMASLINLIKKHDVKVIFAEPQFSPKLVQTLSQDYGLTKGELDPLGQEVSKEGYFKLIQSNINAFKNIFNQ